MKNSLCRCVRILAAATFATAICLPPAIAQHRPPAGNPAPCTPGICVITVTVNDCQAAGGIVLDPPFVSASSAVNLRWKIVTDSYVFAQNGIEFDPPGGPFTQQNSPRPNEFRIRNDKSQNGDFYYYVNVDGCRTVDPFIRNN